MLHRPFANAAAQLSPCRGGITEVHSAIDARNLAFFHQGTNMLILAYCSSSLAVLGVGNVFRTEMLAQYFANESRSA